MVGLDRVRRARGLGGSALAVALALLLAGCARPAADAPWDDPPVSAACEGCGADDPATAGSAASQGPTPIARPTGTPSSPIRSGDASSGVVATPVPPPRPRVVVAVIDSDVNLYHAEYAREGGGVLIPGVPTIPLDLTLGTADRAAAQKADHGLLMGMEPGKLYTFPGTKVAAISFLSKDADWPLVLNPPGAYSHGTMTSSRAVGNTVSILGADPDVDLVFVQGFTTEAVAWAADQPWIDVISISSSLSTVTTVPAAGNAMDAAVIEAFVDASHKKPLFLSTGNGLDNAGVAGFPSWLRGGSGVADAISVGANDNDYFAHWANQDPYVSADGCGNPVAAQSETTGIENTGGGTSSATPFAAGGGAKLILEARRVLGDLGTGPRTTGAAATGWDSLAEADGEVALALGPSGIVAKGPLADGVFTLRELKDVLYHTAIAVPTEDESDGDACASSEQVGNAYFVVVDAQSVPAPARFAAFGYGEINAASVAAGVEALRGAADLPARAEDDAEYARVHALKSIAVG